MYVFHTAGLCVSVCMCVSMCLYLSVRGCASGAQFERCLMSLAQEAVDLLTCPSTSTELPAVGQQSVKQERGSFENGQE